MSSIGNNIIRIERKRTELKVLAPYACQLTYDERVEYVFIFKLNSFYCCHFQIIYYLLSVMSLCALRNSASHTNTDFHNLQQIRFE